MATRFQKSTSKMEVVPDLDDLMDNWFFGNPGGAEIKKKVPKEPEEARDKTSSRLTQEWLEEAKKVVASSSPMPFTSSRLVGSPRFVSYSLEPKDRSIEGRNPRSRSARRHRPSEGISSEIIQKTTARIGRSRSDASGPSSPDLRQQWPTSPSAEHDVGPLSPTTLPTLPPKQQRLPRGSRFLKETPPPLPTRTKNGTLSPPRYLVESAHRRSISATTCSLNNSASLLHRRSVSFSASVSPADTSDIESINAFLLKQKMMVEGISNGKVMTKAKIVLSGSSTNTVSSMTSAICYAWLLENTGDNAVVAPVMNMSRNKMWKHKQAAWLFHHLGIDASALLFADEVDLEGLLVSRQSSILIIGQDVLKTKDEVGSYCTVLTDNYCEDAYNLLQAPNLKKLLLAGILLDTQNLNSAAVFYTNRDAEAIQLLLVGSPPKYRQEFFEQLMIDHRSSPFLGAMKANYGQPPREAINKVTPSPPPAPAPAPAPTPPSEPKPSSPPPVKTHETAPSGKNKFSLAKFFGFGHK